MHKITEADCNFAQAIAKQWLGDHKIPKRYWEDCISEGYLGMMKAATAFDDVFSSNFNTYARPYIEGYMSHYIRSEIKNDKNLRKLLKKLKVLSKQTLQHLFGHENIDS